MHPQPTATWFSIDARDGGTISLSDVYRDVGIGRVLVCAEEGKTVTIRDADDFALVGDHRTDDDGSVSVTLTAEDTFESLQFAPAGVGASRWLILDIATSNCR